MIKQNKFIANYQMSTFIKSSCFACIIWHFPWSCSGSIKSSVAHCICLVRVAKTVLVWCMNDFDSSTSVSLRCIRLFFLFLFSSAASVTFASCLLLTSIFSGFKSWWAVPLLWRNWSPSIKSRPIFGKKNSIFLAQK